MKALLTALMLISAPPIAKAAITLDRNCKAQNIEVQWETTDLKIENGSTIEDSGETLYKDILVTFEGHTTKFKTYKYLTVKDGATLAAWSKAGEYILIKADKLTKDEGDAQRYEGSMELLLKGKTKNIRLKQKTGALCLVFTEA